jgi:hypothetical protein
VRCVGKPSDEPMNMETIATHLTVRKQKEREQAREIERAMLEGIDLAFQPLAWSE